MNYINSKFASTDKTLDKKRKSISDKFLDFYGIHSVGAGIKEQKIKIYVHDLKELPSEIREKIKKQAGDYKVDFIESRTKHPLDFHLEKEIDLLNEK